MRLLSKSDVTTAKAQERKRDIDEGLKVARRIDSLREIATNEEKSLQEFRKRTLEAIHADISTESAKLDVLRSEIGGLEERKRIALIPIDEEREKLDGIREMLDERTTDLDKRETAVKQMEVSATAFNKLAQDNLSSANTIEAEARKAFDNASKTSQEAQTAMQTAILFRTDAETFKRESEQRLEQRESQIKATEARQKNRDKAQDERERELNNRESFVRDREQMKQKNGSN